MTIVCFIGLTIQPVEARTYLDADYFGPVSGGDIPAVIAEYGPDAIGIVDGVFHSRPAVLHKDILYALSRGIAVFGAASMGALRAAEMDSFGMIGVGEVYRRVRSGDWTGDDEVAIPCSYVPGHGWVPVAGAEALVNIRATIDEAIRRGIIDAATGLSIVTRAKTLCYSERQWDFLLDPAALDANTAAVMRMRRAWPDLRVDLKRQDAVEMLKHIAAWAPRERKATSPPKEPCGPFWDAALFSRPLGIRPLGDSLDLDPEDAPLVQDVLDYSIVSDAASASLVQDAMIRTLLLDLASVLGASAEQREADEASKRIACDLSTVRPNAPIDSQEIARLGAEEAVCEALHTHYSRSMEHGLLLTLLAEGRFSQLGAIVRALFNRRTRHPVYVASAGEAREIIENRLARMGIGNAPDHFERYLTWLPEHRLRAAAALVAATDDLTDCRGAVPKL